MNTGTTTSATPRAALATAVFAGAGVASMCRGVSDWAISGPLGLSYALLVTNTYFSVRGFGAIIPRELRDQRAIDWTIGAAYVALAASLANAVLFAAVGTLLFALATLKHALLLGRLDAADLLARKVRVDTLGTIASALAVVAATSGHEHAAVWALLSLNAIANLYLLWWNPLYCEALALGGSRPTPLGALEAPDGSHLPPVAGPVATVAPGAEHEGGAKPSRGRKRTSAASAMMGP
jgi:hypothetical protein